MIRALFGVSRVFGILLLQHRPAVQLAKVLTKSGVQLLGPPSSILATAAWRSSLWLNTFYMLSDWRVMQATSGLIHAWCSYIDGLTIVILHRVLPSRCFLDWPLREHITWTMVFGGSYNVLQKHVQSLQASRHLTWPCQNLLINRRDYRTSLKTVNMGVGIFKGRVLGIPFVTHGWSVPRYVSL